MDLNELLYHHQRAILNAGLNAGLHAGLRAVPGPAPSAFDLVGHYAHRIGRLRERLGVAHYPEWMIVEAGAR